MNRSLVNREVSDDQFVRFYLSRRGDSVARLQVANVGFLVAMLFSYLYVSDYGYLFGNIMTWLLPSSFCLAFALLFKLCPTALERLGLFPADTWPRIGMFVLTLRILNLVRVVLELIGADEINMGLCTRQWPHGDELPVLHLLTDVMESYVWTQFMFSPPWGILLCAVEASCSCTRLSSCFHIFRPYVSSNYYPFLILVSYFSLLAAVHTVLFVWYVTNMEDIRQVNVLSALREKEDEGSHRQVKTALQFVFGSLTGLKNIFVSRGELSTQSNFNSIMQATQRNIRAITLLLDDVTVLTALEEAPFEPATTACVDLLSILRESIRELEDASVPTVSVRIRFNDAASRNPILQCSEPMMNCVFSNVAYHVMAMIRRHSVRQRVGYRPYLNVVGYTFETVRRGQTNLMLRLVFDHNGDMAATFEMAESAKLMDGTEIFAIPGRGGLKANHHMTDDTPIFSVRSYPVLTCRDVYSINDDVGDETKLSPLALCTLHDVLMDCGGALLLQDYYISGDEMASRSRQFNRIVVDIPAKENLQIRQVVPGRKLSNAGRYVGGVSEFINLKFALLIVDKSLRATVSSILQSIGVKFDIYVPKNKLMVKHDFDLSKIMREKYTSVLFDVEIVGSELRKKGYFGERVFFTPNSIILEPQNKSEAMYDCILPIPCRMNALRQYIQSGVKVAGSPALLSREQSLHELTTGDSKINTRSKSELIASKTIGEDFLRRWVKYIHTVCALSTLYNILMTGVVKYCGVLGRVANWLFFESYDTHELLKFGRQFSIKSSAFGMPQFSRNVESMCVIVLCFIT